MPLPNKSYFTLQSLACRWGASFDDIKYYIEHEALQVCCWLDYRDVMSYIPHKGKSAITCETKKFEGYVSVRACDARKVFRCGKYKLTSFLDFEDEARHISVAPHSKEVLISVNDLMVTLKERTRFESENDLEPMEIQATQVNSESDKKQKSKLSQGLYINSRNCEYVYNGNPLSFGAIQSNIIKQLAEARTTGKPWVHGKILLHKAGSQAIRMRDIFKSQAMWRELVESNKRGHYRLRDDLEVDVA
jgi:hypothetical protein